MQPSSRTGVTTAGTTSSGRGILITYGWLSSLLALGILVQAVLASQGLFKANRI